MGQWSAKQVAEIHLIKIKKPQIKVTLGTWKQKNQVKITFQSLQI